MASTDDGLSPDRAALREGLRNATRDAHAEHKAERVATTQRQTERDPEVVAARARRRKTIRCVALFVPFILLTTLNLSGYGPVQTRVAPPDPAEIDDQLRATIYRAVMDIESFRREWGRLPHALSEVGVREPGGWTYEVLDPSRYAVAYGEGAWSLRYDSAGSPATFFDGIGPKRSVAGTR